MRRGVIFVVILTCVVFSLLWESKFIALQSYKRNEISERNELEISDNKETTGGKHQQHQCAPWIPQDERKVLFVGLATMADYSKPDGYKGGEYYISSSIDWALEQLGFRVEVVKLLKWSRMKNFSSYRRTFLNTKPIKKPLLEKHENHCKIRPINFWPSQYYAGYYHPRQVLTAYPSQHHTFVGYFIHGMMQQHSIRRDEMLKFGTRDGRKILLLGKEPKHFVKGRPIMETLLSRNYTLHATCTNCKKENIFPEAVLNHEMISPAAFETLLASCNVVVGFGTPILSPTPLVAISKGTAFLNPVKRGIILRNESFVTQHNAVALMGKPYVYNYIEHDPGDALRAVEEAVNNPFHPFVPYEFRPEAMIARVCSILEDDSVCMFPNETSSSIMEIRAWKQ